MAEGPVEANDVEILVFDPEPSEKTPMSGILLRGDVEHQATNIAEKLAAHVVKLVVLAVEVVAVGVNHPREAERLILELEAFGKAAEQVPRHAFILVFQIVGA